MRLQAYQSISFPTWKKRNHPGTLLYPTTALLGPYLNTSGRATSSFSSTGRVVLPPAPYNDVFRWLEGKLRVTFLLFSPVAPHLIYWNRQKPNHYGLNSSSIFCSLNQETKGLCDLCENLTFPLSFRDHSELFKFKSCKP